MDAVNDTVPPRRRRGRLGLLTADRAALAGLRRRVEETTESIGAIARDLGLPPGSLDRFYKQEGWRRPDGAPGSTGGGRRGPRRVASLADIGGVRLRLLAAIDRQVGRIDARLMRQKAEAGERDARTLGILAKALETLDATGRDDGAKPPEPVDRGSMRAELARRIAAWTEEDAGTDRPAD